MQKGDISYFVLPTRLPQEEYGSNDFDEGDEAVEDDDEDNAVMQWKDYCRRTKAGRNDNAFGRSPGKPQRAPEGSKKAPGMVARTPEMVPRTPYETESNQFVGCHARTRPKATLMEEWNRNRNMKMPKAFKKMKAELIGAKRAAEYRLFDRL